MKAQANMTIFTILSKLRYLQVMQPHIDVDRLRDDSVRLSALASNAFWSMLNQMLSRGSLMATAIILARRFDVESFAAYSYFQLTISMLAAYAAMGLGVAASKFFAEHNESIRPDASVLGALWLISVVLSLLASLVVLALPNDWVNAGLAVPQWAIALGVLILCLQVVPNGAIMGLEEFRRATFIAGGIGAITLAGSVVAVMLDDIKFAMLALLTSALMQFLGESIVVIRRVGADFLGIFSLFRWSRLRVVLDVSGPMALVGIIAASGTWIVGRIILNGSGGEHAFAVFTIGLQWFALAMFIPGAMSRVFLPRMVKNACAGSEDDKKSFIRRAIVATALTSVLIAIAGLVLSPVVTPMYGENYDVSRWLIAPYIGAAVLAAPVATLGNAILAHNGQWRRLGLMMVWGVVLTSTAYLTRSEVLWGGAAAFAASYGFLTLGMLFVGRRMKII